MVGKPDTIPVHIAGRLPDSPSSVLDQKRIAQLSRASNVVPDFDPQFGAGPRSSAYRVLRNTMKRGSVFGVKLQPELVSFYGARFHSRWHETARYAIVLQTRRIRTSPQVWSANHHADSGHDTILPSATVGMDGNDPSWSV
jgi:hypothetical protein